MKKVSTQSYKGVRDFYPHDKFIHDYMVNTLSAVCESFGYEPYDASVLEPSELYRTKTSDEIVNEQTYTFTDRGGREVTLRPEMTPTIARMVAGRSRELSFPLRWYAMPNCFRYERTQRGRLREFWQLNADIFGIEGIEADVEVLLLVHALLIAFGATETDFQIHINDRRVFEHIFDTLEIDSGTRKSIMSLLDRRAKMTDFEDELKKVVGSKTKELLKYIDSAASNPLLENLHNRLITLGIGNVVVDTSIVRGFDYYTGMVFEVFDTGEENSRSIAGGGRYDALMDIFGVPSIPTVGFALGDVTMQNFLETHNLLPEYTSSTDLMMCVLDESSVEFADSVAQTLRLQDINVAINYSYKKVGDQIKSAEKKSIPFIACIGKKEVASEEITIKHLPSRNEKTVAVENVLEYITDYE